LRSRHRLSEVVSATSALRARSTRCRLGLGKGSLAAVALRLRSLGDHDTQQVTLVLAKSPALPYSRTSRLTLTPLRRPRLSCAGSHERERGDGSALLLCSLKPVSALP